MRVASAESPKPDPVDVAGQDAALLSAIEVGLGSFLHSFKVPLSGQFLSLNQIFFLSRSTLKLKGVRAARSIGFQISVIVAMLKSLAPAGKKLTPMLAIAMQGLLFSLGTLLLGVNPIGLVLGATLSSLWAYFQPALLLLLMFGSSLIDVSKYFLEKMSEFTFVSQENLLWVVAGMISLKILLSWSLILAALRLPESTVVRYQKKLMEFRMRKEAPEASPKPVTSPQRLIFLGALGDLTNPLFLISLALTGVFFMFAESSKSQTIWTVLRPLCIGFCFFYLMRWLPVLGAEKWLQYRLFRKIALPFQAALRSLNQVDR